jgi:hypothetical protein
MEGSTTTAAGEVNQRWEVLSASSTEMGVAKTRGLVETRMKANRLVQGKPTVSEPDRALVSHRNAG